MATPRLLSALRGLAHSDAAKGLVLVAATGAALVVANTGGGDESRSFWAREVGLAVAGLEVRLTLHAWVSEALLALFFLLIGLELKRELASGELSDPRKALLPVAGALGGILVAGGIYLGIVGAFGTRAALAGWAIPIATDVAFAVGLFGLFAWRVPETLEVVHKALAIVDEVVIVAVIAFIYRNELAPRPLAVAAAVVLVLLALGRLGVRSLVPYLLALVALGATFHAAGIHPSLAGVVVGLGVPTRRPEGEEPASIRLERLIAPWVTFGVLPLFVLANAGIPLSVAAFVRMVTEPVPVAILLALVAGKELGVLGASYAVVRLGWTRLPDGVGWRRFQAAAALAGVGFTMSLLVISLAFRDDTRQASDARLAVLVGSILAGAEALLLARWHRPRRPPPAGGVLGEALRAEPSDPERHGR